jgi:hypothetical protein
VVRYRQRQIKQAQPQVKHKPQRQHAFDRNVAAGLPPNAGRFVTR